MWYKADDVMILLGVGKSKAYQIIRDMADEIAKTKIPGQERCYYRPPSGKIRRDFFCEKFMLNQKECDKMIKNFKEGGISA